MGNLLILFDDGFVQWAQATNKVDILFAVSIAVPMAETDKKLKLGFDTGFFMNLADDGRRQMLPLVQRAPGNL